MSKVLVHSVLPENMSANKKGGFTIAVRKRGGWRQSYLLGLKLAGWVEV